MKFLVLACLIFSAVSAQPDSARVNIETHKQKCMLAVQAYAGNEETLQRRQPAFMNAKQKIWQDHKTLILTITGFLAILIAMLVKLQFMNKKLKTKITKALKRQRRQEHMMIQQSKMIETGQVIKALITQWKQPLTAIYINAQNIEDLSEADGCDRQELLQTQSVIVHQVEMINERIDAFSDFFTPSHVKTEFVACEDIKKLVFLFETEFKESNIEVFIPDHEHITVVGYPNEFKQVVLSILYNAKDAILQSRKAHGYISITFAKEQGYGCIYITDDGGGIKPSLLPEKLFGATCTTKGKNGSGIGLYLSKSIIERNMHGKLAAKNIEGGAQFSIKLPLAKGYH